MLASLMTPGGRLGVVTVALAVLIATGGVIGVILGITGIGMEDDAERVGAAIVGAASVVGALGLSMQPRRPVLGGVLAVLGSVGAALLNSWLIVPILVVPVTIAVVVMRARRFGAGRDGSFAGQEA
jgi:hypothetical protein